MRIAGDIRRYGAILVVMRVPHVLSVLALVTACAPKTEKPRDWLDEERPDPAGGDGGGLDIGLDLDGGTGPTGPTSCSADLQTVTDPDGNPIQRCPADQGCHAGACIPACEAAAKSKGTVGCSFVAPTPSFQPRIGPPCFAVFLANAWSRPIKISVRRGAQAFDVTKFGRVASDNPDPKSWAPVPAEGLPVGQVAVLFMSSDPSSTNAGSSLACPVPPAIGSSTAVPGTGKGQAFVVETDAPVSAYDILPFGGAASYLPSAQLLLPTSAWGTNYVGVVPKKEGGSAGPQWAQIVAAEDGTTVRINARTRLPSGGGIPGGNAGTVTTVTLNAGEFAQWQPTEEMSGSVIQSDKPVAFIGGNGYLCLSSSTSRGGGCDSAHQMLPPVSALGSEYVGPPYVTRRADLQPESIPYRIVGAVDGTSLTFDPPIPAAPASLAAGQSVDFQASQPFVVKSQDADHPFYLAQMMPGNHVTGGTRTGSRAGGKNLGDEEHVGIYPPRQFLSKYVFFTDPTYSTTNVVVTRVKTPSGFKDVSLACSGPLSGWKPVGTSGQYEIAELDLVRSGAGVGGCKNGPQVATSDGPFGLMVWGTDYYASYAYPAGGNVGTLNNVVIDPGPR
jgi:hypothetical protein